MGDRPQRRVPLDQLAQSIGLDRVVRRRKIRLSPSSESPSSESPPERERSRISLGEGGVLVSNNLAQAHGGQLGEPLGLARDALAIDEDVVARIVAAERVVGVGDHDARRNFDRDESSAVIERRSS